MMELIKYQDFADFGQSYVFPLEFLFHIFRSPALAGAVPTPFSTFFVRNPPAL